MRKYSDDVLRLQVPGGTSNNTQGRKLNPGAIVGVIAFTNGQESTVPGIVSLEIQDSNGTPVTKMQPLDNYKRREGGTYLQSAKPFFAEGGELYNATIQATSNFGALFIVDLVFIYETQNDDSCTM